MIALIEQSLKHRASPAEWALRSSEFNTRCAKSPSDLQIETKSVILNL